VTTTNRVVVDPITRIEGHLRIEAQVDGGKVTDAWSSATMFRGLEKIVTGRDPRDAWYFTQRICGVCTTVHALASVRSVEDALGITPPKNARLIRDLIAATQYVHDHVVHFYHLHALDWVDVTSALKADPVKAASAAGSLSEYPKSSASRLRAVRDRLAAFVQGGRLGPFASGYWGHPAYHLSPEVDLLATSHYLDALDWQREYVKVHAILGGKNPHPQSYVVGGMTTAVDPNSPNALNDDAMQQMRGLLQAGLAFVEQAYLPDLVAIAQAYPEWASIGGGLGNYLSFGDFSGGPQPQGGPITDGVLPSGVVLGRDLARVAPVDPKKITEAADHSWFDDASPPPAARGREHPALHRPETALRAPRRRRQVLVAEVAAVRRHAGRGRPARPRRDRLRPQGFPFHPARRGVAAQAQGDACRTALHARPDPRPRPGDGRPRPPRDRRPRPVAGQHRRWRPAHVRRHPLGPVDLAREGPRCGLPRSPPAAGCRTGSSSSPGRWRTTRRSSRRPGTPDRATARASAGPTRRPWSGRRSRTRSSRWRSCAPSTRSTRAWPARHTSWGWATSCSPTRGWAAWRPAGSPRSRRPAPTSRLDALADRALVILSTWGCPTRP
jgi:hypothetical protein